MLTRHFKVMNFSTAHLLQFLVIFLLSTKTIQGQSSATGSVIVTFKNPPTVDNFFYFTKTNWTRKDHLISVFDNRTETQHELKPKFVPDPIQIDITGKYLVLRSMINYLEYNDYVLEKGDSVLVDYSEVKPVVTVRNRKTLAHDANVEDLSRRLFMSDEYAPLARYFGAANFSGKKILSDKDLMAESYKLSYRQKMDRNKRFVSEIKQSFYSKAKLQLDRENDLLDSLSKTAEISQVTYQYQKQRVRYLTYQMEVETNRMNSVQATMILKAHVPNTFGYPEPHYLKFVEAAADRFVIEPNSFMEIQDGVNRDNRQLFNQIDTSSLFNESARNHLLTREINRIHNNFSKEDFLSYFKLYAAKVKDSSYINMVRENFALDFDSSRNETSSLILADIKGNKLTFDDLKKRHRGKIIYVDFWASWCGPCREAMPASSGLRRSFKNKNIVFVYLSIDNNIKPWQNASIKEKLDIYPENYLIVNQKTSEFLKLNKLNSIPRYMIFDKSGRLTHANAPRVEMSTTGLLLNQLADKH